jgi:MoaA/NifB/PqqE/SkfB family radical SAM enzyme
MQLDNKMIKGYADSRFKTDKKLLCHAPSVNLNFEQNGSVRACCYNTKHLLGKWPEQSIKEIWMGEKVSELRAYIQNNNLGGGCSVCGDMIADGNFQGVRARYFDEFSPGMPWDRLAGLAGKLMQKPAYPKVMEFELSNACNLECIMCNGYFSSGIRKNREHLPPLHPPYNDKFVDELEEFIPHLQVAKFLGGEPFMIDIYLEIWERIKKINPGVQINITTNGTFLNERIKRLLEGLKVGIIVSIDSIVPSTYRAIRVNGNYDRVMENLEYFRKYTVRKKTFLSLAACPMVNNWKELPGLLNFCIAKNIALYFNPVFNPEALSLRGQSTAYLEEVIAFLQNHPPPPVKGSNWQPGNLSIHAYTGLINMLQGWRRERMVHA